MLGFFENKVFVKSRIEKKTSQRKFRKPKTTVDNALFSTNVSKQFLKICLYILQPALEQAVAYLVQHPTPHMLQSKSYFVTTPTLPAWPELHSSSKNPTSNQPVTRSRGKRRRTFPSSSSSSHQLIMSTFIPFTWCAIREKKRAEKNSHKRVPAS